MLPQPMAGHGLDCHASAAFAVAGFLRDHRHAGGVKPLDFAAADEEVGEPMEVVGGEHDGRLGRQPFPCGGRPAT